jgi:hypothetical protein
MGCIGGSRVNDEDRAKTEGTVKKSCWVGAGFRNETERAGRMRAGSGEGAIPKVRKRVADEGIV